MAPLMHSNICKFNKTEQDCHPNQNPRLHVEKKTIGLSKVHKMVNYAYQLVSIPHRL